MPFNPKQAKLVATCEHPGTLYALGYDPQRDSVYVAGSDGAVYRVDAKAEKPAAEKLWTHHDNYVSCLAVLGGTLVSGGYDRRLVWTDAETGRQIRVVEAHAGWVRDLVAFADGRRLASVGDDMLVKIWDAESGELLSTLDAHARLSPEGYATALYAVAVSPDGTTIASGDRIGEICLWDAVDGKLLGRLKAPTFYTYDPVKRSRSIGGIRSLCFSPDGADLAVGGIGQVSNVDGFVGPCRVEVWDWRKGQRKFEGQDQHKAIFNQVGFRATEAVNVAVSPAITWLIGAGGGDGGGILAFWDQQSPQPAHKAPLKGHVQDFCLNAAGTRLFAAGHGGLQIWSFEESNGASGAG